MTRILITGGAGELGSALAPRLMAAGYTVRVMSRKPRPPAAPAGMEWAQADLESGAGLAAAVTGVDTLVNSASSTGKSGGPMNPRAVDVAGTRHLLGLAQKAGVRHAVHVSIVGIDRIDMDYYRHKVAAEAVVRDAGLPYTILRATQFHSLIHGRLRPLARFPVALIPSDYKFQSIDTGEVADRLAEVAAQPPAGLLPDLGGPQVLSLGEMARAWFSAQGKAPPIIHLPTFGGMADGFRRARNTCPDHRDGQITWAQWLASQFGAAGATASASSLSASS